ncbi:3379_t:CDS:2, partial [Paraglomus occultum]
SSTVRQRKLNKATELWVHQAIAINLLLSDQILQEKGLEFAESCNIKDDDIRCSNGWVYKFKKRIGVHQITLHGEANSASLTGIAEERLRLQEVLAEYIYNVDETGLFYRMEPPVAWQVEKRTNSVYQFYYVAMLLELISFNLLLWE